MTGSFLAGVSDPPPRNTRHTHRDAADTDAAGEGPIGFATLRQNPTRSNRRTS